MVKVKRKKTARSTSAVDKYIGGRMLELRKARGLSQAALGAKLGVTFQQVQKYEKGENRISAARLFEICQVLGTPLASMFKDKLEE